MSHCAEFQIIGRIGQIKKVGTTLRVTIASGYPYKDDRGEWQERTRWNQITVFNDSRQSYVQRNLKSGGPHPRHRRPRADELGEERRNPLRRHPRLRADRTPRQGPGSRRRRRRSSRLTKTGEAKASPPRLSPEGRLAARPSDAPLALWRFTWWISAN